MFSGVSKILGGTKRTAYGEPATPAQGDATSGKSPTSEAKKANAAASLANLFQSGSDDAVEMDVVADLMSADNQEASSKSASPARKKAKTAGEAAKEAAAGTRRSARGGNAPPEAPTPQRAAGASVLASIAEGGGGNEEMKPPALPPPVADVATVEGGVQHDYLLQNLVHATKVTSPLPNPKGKKPAAVPAAPPALQPPPAAVEGGIKFADVPGEPLPPQQETKSRKDKSLGVLCVNFMKLFEDKPPNRDNNGQVIEISAVADFLQVKRRRIYDVINILESIDVVCRVKKNTYRWHGVDNLPRYFAELQKAGLEERAASEAVAAVAAAGGEAAVPAGAKTKGMAQTCQKLIQIFLVSGRTEIGLTEAAEEVLGPLSPAEEANAAKAMKTKVRRMYDIANVLQSLGILQKENVGSTSLQNKPSFRWVYRIEPTAMGDYLSTGTRPMVDVRATAHSSAPPVGSAAPLLPEGAVELPVVTPADVVAAAESAATAAALAEPPVAPEQPAEEQNVSMQV